MKLIAICGLLLLYGCVDNPDGWEFNVYAPKDTTIGELLEIEKTLKTNGYKRVRIVEIDYGRTVLISATKKQGGGK